MEASNSKPAVLRLLLSQDGAVVAPGVYDALTARLVERAGFSAMLVSGAAVSASLLGRPDLGFLTMTESVTQTRNIVTATNLPVIADGDNGYGSPVTVTRTIAEYEGRGWRACSSKTKPRRSAADTSRARAWWAPRT